ncbi:LysR family transcriptional regulator [Actinomadura fulvescens]|uniref:HTH lysR-type domain-containing protein n=1 Tax=Actinomadura fulvescens TaxID=46160 RepID=A0ABN3QZX8_9ACTN
MELRQLRYFSAVAQEEHLTRAAGLLGIRGTSLSQQIIALERELGTALFRRTPGGMVLTAAGQALLPHARRSLDAAHAGIRAVQNARSAERTWRVGVTPGAPAAVIASMRARVHEVDLLDLPVSHQLEALSRGDLDAALIVLPAATSGLSSRIVSDVPLGVLMSSGHPLTGRVPLGWNDLDGQELLWFHRELAPGYHDAMLEAFRLAGWRPRRIRRGPPRRGLFVAELTHSRSVVAVRPEWDGGDRLAWSPLPSAPRLRHALVWSPSHPDAGRLGDLAREAMAETDEAVPHGRPSGPSV